MFMGRGATFANRADAGMKLGEVLESEYKDRNVLVLGVPRGGVEVAYYVARIINGELSVIVSKKLPFPGQEELACGAITEDGSAYISEIGQRLAPGLIDKLKEEQLEEIKRRVQEYRGGKPLPDMTNRIVLIVDDGIATGSTIVPTLELVKANKAAKIVVAAPVSGRHILEDITNLADEVVIVEQPSDFYAVGQVYDDFHGLEDYEVKDFLNRFDKRKDFVNK